MVLSWLRKWWYGHAARRLGRVRMVMYTRHGCHLCEEAWRLLECQRQRYGFVLEAADVDADPELAARYGLEVPVITVDGKVRFRGIVNPHLLERLLRKLASRT
jgi:glutaredoxin